MNCPTELHTSDLIHPCPRAAMLRLEGKAIGTMSTALYRGLVAGKALEGLHKVDPAYWPNVDLGPLVFSAGRDTQQEAYADNQTLTAAVLKNQGEIHEEIVGRISHYIDRLQDLFEGSELIGTEVPCRFTLTMPDGEPQEFASHLDLLPRDPNGQLCVWDWKFQQEAPTMAYLARNLQFALYYLVVADPMGRILVDGSWQALEEFPKMGWVDLANFKAYSRKTTVGDRVYSKGDIRPMRNIVREWTVSPDRHEDVKDALRERVSMARAGFWPAIPSKRGCQYCESQQWCPAFHTDKTEGQFTPLTQEQSNHAVEF